jgi:hypothetical protein
MRILISIVLFVGLCLLILGALVRVLRDLLIRITIYSPSQYDGPGVGSKRAASPMVSEQVQ